MITLKLNLRQLNHALMTTPKGAKVIVIPFKENNIFEGEKGLYLDIIGFEFEDKSDKKYKDTHLLKLSFSKEELAAMSDEQRKALPILGTARVNTGQPLGEPEPKDMNSGNVADGLDKLPF